MADILIRGISMPKSCLDCNFSGDYGDCCCKDTEPYECEFHKKSRPDWCPLVELPEHGDLIDREWLKEMAYSKVEDFGGAFLDTIDIAIASVVVPSNKEETE